MKYLIVGLGNIGVQYAMTRHNVGFMILDRMAAELGFSFSMEKLAYVAETSIKNKKLVCIKPITFMNLSGKAVRYYMQAYKIPKERVLVLVDDLALDFGKIRIRGKGSAAGHNGLKNIESELQSQDYARLRFGIGSDFSRGRQVDYVLGDFPDSDTEDLIITIDRCIGGIQCFCLQGLSAAMTEFNGLQ